MMKKCIKVRMSEEILQQLDIAVAMTSLSREAFVRCLILGYRPREQPSVSLPFMPINLLLRMK